ncbi:MAG: hypothetical protein KGI71_04640 [Patescibacteria group bacterium]|nr:hypothetical protein [Patescibacteria group bacterium]
MNQVATTTSRAIIADVPRMTPALRDVMRRVLNPHPDVGLRLEAVPAHVQTEARGIIPQLEALCCPAGADLVRHWLLPINSAVSQPLGPEDFDARAAAIAAAVGDMPMAVFMPRNQAEAMRTWRWFPSAADVADFLGPKARVFTGPLWALRQVAEGRPETEPTPLTDEQRTAISEEFWAKWRTMRAEAGLDRPPEQEPAKPVIRPAYLTGDALARFRGKTA